MRIYYNEFDKKIADWLRKLCEDGHLPSGDIDEHSIRDVSSNDIGHYDQCHFFAGIGGWPLALRWAGLEGFSGIWTGSCPCQPFSSAGAKKGIEDERHLWPVWYNLIKERKPRLIFGEQVEAAIKHGWLDTLQTDLEKEGYAIGAAVLPACSLGAPHLRKRLFFGSVRIDAIRDVAKEWYAIRQSNASGIRWDGGSSSEALSGQEGTEHSQRLCEMLRSKRNTSDAGDVCNTGDERRKIEQEAWWEERRPKTGRSGGAFIGSDNDCERQHEDPSIGLQEKHTSDEGACRVEFLRHTKHDGSYRQKTDKAEQSGDRLSCELSVRESSYEFIPDSDSSGQREHSREKSVSSELSGVKCASNIGMLSSGSPWENTDWIYYADGKFRPAKHGRKPLAHGVPNRLVALRGAGNAIVPQVAQVFIEEFMNSIGDL